MRVTPDGTHGAFCLAVEKNPEKDRAALPADGAQTLTGGISPPGR